MNKNEIITNLNTAHSVFWDTAIHLPNLSIAVNDKWSVGQNVEHINIALLRLGNYLSLPKKSIESNFGLSQRESISNEALIKNYLKALANGVKATAAFIPELNPETNKQELVDQGKNLLQAFISNLENWSEEELERYNCPHPVFGNITVREMLYFTIYHVQHHNEIIKKTNVK
jgi:hypothetical protein